MARAQQEDIPGFRGGWASGFWCPLTTDRLVVGLSRGMRNLSCSNPSCKALQSIHSCVHFPGFRHSKFLSGSKLRAITAQQVCSILIKTFLLLHLIHCQVFTRQRSSPLAPRLSNGFGLDPQAEPKLGFPENRIDVNCHLRSFWLMGWSACLYLCLSSPPGVGTQLVRLILPWSLCCLCWLDCVSGVGMRVSVWGFDHFVCLQASPLHSPGLRLHFIFP